MRKIHLYILLINVIVLSAALVVYLPLRVPNSNSTETTPNSGLVELETYSWKGVESIITPLDEYIKSINGSGVYFSDLLWPLADSENPFHDLVEKGTGVAIVTVLSVDRAYREFTNAYIVYKARIDKVIVEPRNTIELPSQAECAKDPELCDLAMKQHEAINNLISMIKENNIIELIVPAFVAKDAVNKISLTLDDVASPFPLLEPQYRYVVFIDVELDGIYVHYDFVWGPWAYLVLDGRVYSFNYVKPPDNITLDPSELFKTSYIYWKPHPYEQLRKIAIQKLSANGEQLESFISKITRG